MAVQTSYLSCVLIILAANCMLFEAAPSSSGSGNSQMDRDLLAGLKISVGYSKLLNGSSQSNVPDVVDKFCDLLSHYEMVKKVNSETNGTENNGLAVMEILLRQNLADTCHWISLQINDSAITVHPPLSNLFSTDSCSFNQTTPLHEACTLYRTSTIVRMTYYAVIDVTEPVQGVNRCEWISQKLSEPHSQLMSDLFNC